MTGEDVTTCTVCGDPVERGEAAVRIGLGTPTPFGWHEPDPDPVVAHLDCYDGPEPVVDGEVVELPEPPDCCDCGEEIEGEPATALAPVGGGDPTLVRCEDCTAACRSRSGVPEP